MSPLLQVIVMMFCAAGLVMFGQRLHLLRSGFIPEELYEGKNGTVHINGEENDLAKMKWDAIGAVCAFPAVLTVAGFFTVISVFLVEKLNHPGMTFAWFEAFLEETFPHSGSGLPELLKDLPVVVNRFHGLYTRDVLNTAVAVAMLLHCAGISLLVPARRKSVGTVAFRIWAAGRGLSARRLRIRRIACAVCVFAGGLLMLWTVGVYGVCLICFRSTL